MEGFKPEFHVLAQALVAICLGGLVGWERETAGKWAGIRTHMLVCLAAMLFVRAGEFLILQAQHIAGHDTLRTDPVRIVEAIVTGIAFIGAGTVFRDRERHVAEGLTTAASLLAVAPIGVAVAAERYIVATGATALVFFILRAVNRLEIRARLKRQPPAPSQPYPTRPHRPARQNPPYRNGQRERDQRSGPPRPQQGQSGMP